MSVLNNKQQQRARKLKFTEHAKERMVERFGVAPQELMVWKDRFFENAELIDQSQGLHSQRWQSGAVIVVADYVHNTIVTAYTAPEQNYITGLHPVVKESLDNALDAVKHTAIRDFAGKVSAKYQDLADVAARIAHDKQNDRVDCKFDNLLHLQSEIKCLAGELNQVLQSVERIS
jgi:hypothetical protein